MDCVNHPGVNAAVYCQNCGKALCTACVRREVTGQVLCEPCWTMWQSARTPYAGPMAPPAGCPSPVLAAILGFIPGVGAMFNGQFLKGFLHVIVFAVLASMSEFSSVFGWLIAAWIFYQVFDAYHTAKAKCEGLPLPDPLGLNELVSWFGHEVRRSQQGVPPAPPAAGPVPPPAAAGYVPPMQAQTPNPYQSGYQPPPAGAGFTPGAPPISGAPPAPPVPPVHWRRREPIAAVILIAMGVLFLLGQFSWHAMKFTWPIMLIVLGAWLVVRRMQDTTPLAPAPPEPNVPPSQGPRWEETSSRETKSDEDPQGGSR